MMKTYQILLLDKITKKVEKIEDFKDSEEHLKDRLFELQKGYCENEYPTVTVQEVTSKGMKIKIAIAESDCDYCHIAAL